MNPLTHLAATLTARIRQVIDRLDQKACDLNQQACGGSDDD